MKLTEEKTEPKKIKFDAFNTYKLTPNLLGLELGCSECLIFIIRVTNSPHFEMHYVLLNPNAENLSYVVFNDLKTITVYYDVQKVSKITNVSYSLE